MEMMSVKCIVKRLIGEAVVFQYLTFHCSSAESCSLSWHSREKEEMAAPIFTMANQKHWGCSSDGFGPMGNNMLSGDMERWRTADKAFTSNASHFPGVWESLDLYGSQQTHPRSANAMKRFWCYTLHDTVYCRCCRFKWQGSRYYLLEYESSIFIWIIKHSAYVDDRGLNFCWVFGGQYQRVWITLIRFPRSLFQSLILRLGLVQYNQLHG